MSIHRFPQKPSIRALRAPWTRRHGAASCAMRLFWAWVGCGEHVPGSRCAWSRQAGKFFSGGMLDYVTSNGYVNQHVEHPLKVKASELVRVPVGA